MMSELFDEQAMREQYQIARDLEVYAEGYAKGYAKGYVKGYAKGYKKGVLKSLDGLVKDGVLTIEQAADEAAMVISEFEALTESKKA